MLVDKMCEEITYQHLVERGLGLLALQDMLPPQPLDLEPNQAPAIFWHVSPSLGHLSLDVL
jgi:hypothetical protein